MNKLAKLQRQRNKPAVSELEAILGADNTNSESIDQIDLDLIDIVSGFNPRYAYLSDNEKDSIMSHEALEPLIQSMTTKLKDGELRGILQPLVLKPKGNRFELVAGERRFRAAQFAAFKTVPAIVRSMTDQEALEIAVIENEQRQNVDQVSQAMSGFRLMCNKTDLTEEQLILHLNAVRQGTEEDRYHLENYLQETFGTGISTWSQQRAKVLQLTNEERLAIQTGKLSAKSAFCLIQVADLKRRQALLERALALEEPPSARQMQALIEEDQPRPTPGLGKQFKKLGSALDKLEGEQASRAKKLLEELQLLVNKN